MSKLYASVKMTKSVARVIGALALVLALNVNAQTGISTVPSASAQAALTSPLPGSTLTSSTATFEWSTGTNALAYHLYVGTTLGGQEFYSNNLGVSRSITVGGLPTNGSTIHVRLWTQFSAGWQSTDYTYTASSTGGSAGDAPASLTSPVPGSTLTSATASFEWSAGSNALAYHLYVGATPAGREFYSNNLGASRSVTVGGLPTNGSMIYVRLWTQLSAGWRFADYTFTASSSGGGAGDAQASLTSPTPGSTLTSSTATFEWSTGTNAQAYHLYVGTTPGGREIYSNNLGVSRSVTVGGLPTNGSMIYVRLWTQLTSGWQFTDYTYSTR